MYRLPKSEFSVGLDISSKALEDAKKKGMKNVSFIQCDVTKGLPLKEGIFDVIICADNLEHVTEPAKVVENIYHLSKQDTRIIFSVPNETLFLKIKFLLRWLRLSSLILKNIEGKKSEWHLHHDFNEKKLRSIISNRFHIIKVKSAYFMYVITKVKKG